MNVANRTTWKGKKQYQTLYNLGALGIIDVGTYSLWDDWTSRKHVADIKFAGLR